MDLIPFLSEAEFARVGVMLVGDRVKLRQLCSSRDSKE